MAASACTPCLPSLSMDSLVANYASSDDDDDEDEEEQGGAEGEEQDPDVSASAVKFFRLPPSRAPSSSSVFSSSLPPPGLAFVLPPSSSSSVFSSLPPPRSLPSDIVPSHLGEVDGEEDTTPSSTSFKAPRSVFSALPPPKLPSPSLRSSSLRLGEEDDHEEEKSRVFSTGKPSSTPFASQNLKFSSIPPPKKSSSSSLFSTIPLPKSEKLGPEKSMNTSSSDLNPNRGVQFKLPPNPSALNSGKFDDEEEDVKGRSNVKDSSSSVPKASSSLSFSWLPAPKNTFGSVPSSGSASSRRSIVDTDVSADNSGGFASVHESSSVGSGDYQAYNGGWIAAPTESANDETAYMSISNNGAVGWDQTGAEGAAYSGFDDNVATSYWDPSYGGATEYGSYQGNWSESTAADTSDVPDIGKIAGKRGRNEIPTEIMEVKQDELMKNRPRQDQTKLTGIAFGPSYQISLDKFIVFFFFFSSTETEQTGFTLAGTVVSHPTSSGKGKPTKLHKRKHQIGSLYFDMRQKEMELAERRSRGLLTKAETQAKYGW
ncbi:hypothetical protein ZIOFF_073719 [Zingiber officinale]|uniref:Proline-rich protein PRCC n=1 Tax=Zingiber officinale TaxID=94328 RepID=A0A8J5C9P4_ZINOF|nr:hypothetical protein ZIOFF_073719 [Zingiber officinale]